MLGRLSGKQQIISNHNLAPQRRDHRALIRRDDWDFNEDNGSPSGASSRREEKRRR